MQPLWKTVWNFLKKLKMELPFHPVIPRLGLCPKNPETPIEKNLRTPMFIAALFTIAKCWKQPKCPSVNKVDHKTVVHLHNGILRTRKKELLPFETVWMELESISEMKPGSKRQIPYDLTYKWNLINKTRKRVTVTRGVGLRGKLGNEGEVSS